MGTSAARAFPEADAYLIAPGIHLVASDRQYFICFMKSSYRNRLVQVVGRKRLKGVRRFSFG